MRIGRRHARESELEDFLSSLVRANRGIGHAARGKVDIHCAQALPKISASGDKPSSLARPYNCGADLNEISAMIAKAADRDSNAFCRQGFGTLLAKSRRRPFGAAFDAGHAHRYVEQGRCGCPDAKGDAQGRYVIVTASPPCCRRADQFGLELPKRQLDALAKLKLGSFDHIALEFNGNPLGLQRDDLVFEQSSNTQTGALLANIAGTQIATVSVGGRFGRQLAAKTEREMVDFAIGWLTGLYGGDIRRAVKRTHVTRWNNSPFVPGAFATAGPGGALARKTMMEPIRDRIYFAGEAFHETQYGTVGGAGFGRASRRSNPAPAGRAEGSGRAQADAVIAAPPRPQPGMSRPKAPKALIAWSSGKDSAWALHEVRRAGELDVVGALTTITDAFGRVSIHGLRQELLTAQLAAAGLSPVTVRIPYPCPNGIYEREMAARWTRPRRKASRMSSSAICFWKTCAPTARRGSSRSALRRCFPSGTSRPTRWHDKMIASGVDARLVCVDLKKLPSTPPAAASTRRCSLNCRRASTDAARTASFILSSSPGRCWRSLLREVRRDRRARRLRLCRSASRSSADAAWSLRTPAGRAPSRPPIHAGRPY